MARKLLRRSASHIHLSFGGDFSNNLIGTDFEADTGSPYGLRFSLEKNLRARSTSNSYADARELADGAIARLDLVQIDEPQILSALDKIVGGSDEPSARWTVTIVLASRVHRFLAVPERTPAALFLRIIKTDRTE